MLALEGWAYYVRRDRLAVDRPGLPQPFEEMLATSYDTQGRTCIIEGTLHGHTHTQPLPIP